MLLANEYIFGRDDWVITCRLKCLRSLLKLTVVMLRTRYRLLLMLITCDVALLEAVQQSLLVLLLHALDLLVDFVEVAALEKREAGEGCRLVTPLGLEW